MKRFDIVTIFPEVVEPYINASILKRAQDKRLVKITVHDLRKYTKDKHRKVDDTPYGGGHGMVMTIESFLRAVIALKKSKVQSSKSKSNRKSKKTRVLLMSEAVRPFKQKRARSYG